MFLPLYFLFFHLILIQEKTLQETKFTPFYQAKPLPSFFKSQNKTIHQKVSSKEQAEFIMSVVTGNQRGFNKTSLAPLIKKFNLIHLMTPSGLHLTVVLFLFFLLIKKRKHRLIILFVAYGVLSYYQIFLPIKRIITLRLFSLLLHKHLSPLKIFFGGFIFDLLLGSYHDSPVSFYFSMLFLGIIYDYQEKPIYPLWINFFIAQCLIHCFFDTPFFAASILINSALLFYFPFFFLLSLFVYLLPCTILIKTHSFFFQYFVSFLHFFDQVIWDQYSLNISFITITLLVIITYFPYQRKIFFILLFLNANYLNIVDKDLWTTQKERDLFPHSQKNKGIDKKVIF